MASLPAVLLGALAMTGQILLLREFAAQFYGNEMTYGLVLASWLLWGGLGSLAGDRRRIRAERIPYAYLGLVLIVPAGLVALRSSRFVLGTLPGELVGLGPALVFALAIALTTSLPLGLLFVANARRLEGDVGRTYLLESLGAAAAGIVLNFILVPRVSNMAAAVILGILIAVLTALSFRSRRSAALALAACAGLAVFAALDGPSRRLEWKPFDLVATRDTPYGKLQAVRTAEQVTFYSDKRKLFTSHDPASSEEAVHFALLQRPARGTALLIGGGAGGNLAQALKYPELRIEYIELDPEVIRLALRHLPAEDRAPLGDPRVRVVHEDGRARLRRSEGGYAFIVLDLPEPATAQVNRFYTREFFALARAKLAPGGVLGFRLSSAENYIGPDLAEFLATIRETLGAVFPEVAVVPGAANIFLASTRPLTRDPDELERRIRTAGLENVAVRPGLLSNRLSEARRAHLDRALEGGAPSLNTDLRPRSYFFSAVLWARQFRSVEAGLLKALAGVPRFWLLDAPLLLFVAGLAAIRLRRRGGGRVLIPVAVMGLTSIVFEIAVILAYQVYYGSVYGRIALLMAAFMAGLALGAAAGRARPATAARADLAAAQGGFILLLTAFLRLLKTTPPQAGLAALLIGFGFLSGLLFIAASRLYAASGERLGAGYGWDLIGSFLGALAASSVLIPLVGLDRVVIYLILANSACLLFLLERPPRKPSA
ncbi:MAG: fused MFS/spermidine synthase [Candidatus Aminicenantes bacterium]|nr:fused MFS/spermidine synthase [Candidatus Aminicenantes bacterium]